MQTKEVLTTDEILSRMRLQRIPKLGVVKAHKILNHLGSAEAFFRLPKNQLKKLGFKNSADIQNLSYLENAKKEYDWLQKKGYGVTTLESTNYPLLLKECIDAPIVLFLRGQVNFSRKRIISVVGTRKISKAGKRFIEEFIEELAPYNPLIVSGFAYGADICAQRAALKHQLQTVGCLAHGLDKIYPSAHYKYANEVAENGGFLTEFNTGTTPMPFNFVQRNRIIAGLSEATVMIESPQKGGSLITASMAQSYHREVFAVPAHPYDQHIQGGNELIKRLQAQMITSASDLVMALKWDELPFKRVGQIKKQISNPLMKQVHEYLIIQGKQHIDVMSSELNQTSAVMSAVLFEMELNGWIRALAGKHFEAI